MWVSGRVVMRVFLDTEGKVREVAITEHSHRELDKAASQAVCCYKYSPAIAKGKPIDSVAVVVLNFSVRSDFR
jgi:TonB family protein